MLASRDGQVDAPMKLVDLDHLRLYRPFNYDELTVIRITTEKQAGEVLDQFRIGK